MYVLTGPTEESYLPTIYVGEGDPVRPRLESHFSRKDFWTSATCFVAKDSSLNKAHIQHLEARLVELALACRRSRLDNQCCPQRPALSESDHADAESFLAHMLTVFPVVGINVFESAPGPQSETTILSLRGRTIQASGYECDDGFVVVSGSEAVLDENPSLRKTQSDLRRDLFESGAVISEGGRLRFTQDYVFNSPSVAAAVLLGRSANGRIEWQDNLGRTLKQIQQSAAGE
ncbi:MAG TPA: GIY-YIG nuclease family protein [Planctomycetaceae bacterium]|nr:GIY-YIG nuclease family protein [Planctomycetaceae bacterium]